MIGLSMKPLKIRKSYRVAFDSEGKRLACLSRDVSVWELASGRKVFRAHLLSHPSHCCFSPSSKQLAVKATSGRIMIIDTDKGEMLSDFQNSDDGEGCNLLYSCCGDYVVDGSWGGKVFVRHSRSGEIEYLREFPTEMIRAVHRCDQGRAWILQHKHKSAKSGHSPAPIYFSVWTWPFQTFRLLNVQAERPMVRGWSSAVTDDGALLALVAGAPPKTLAIFRVADGTLIDETEVSAGGSGSALSWSRDGRFIGSVQDKKSSRLFSDRLVENIGVFFTVP